MSQMRATLMARRCKIGDVIEIPTRIGLAYAQYSCRHSNYGYLLRVLQTTYQSRPDHLADMVREKEKFVAFFPLQAAINREIFHVIANFPVPSEASGCPIFRTGMPDPQTRKVEIWWLWDGEKSWKVGELTSAQRKLPLRGIWNDTLLIERIETGWLPENDPW